MSYRDVTGALGALLRLIGYADNLREVRASLVMQKAEAEHARAEAGKLDRAPWTALEPCEGRDPSEGAIAGLLAEHPEWTRADAYREIARWNGEEVSWVNSIYQVTVRTTPGQTAHLAITRRDGLPVDSWEDMQRIKAELIGSECEAVELYPAESRSVDRSNTRHLWANCVADFRFPIGFAEGSIAPKLMPNQPPPTFARTGEISLFVAARLLIFLDGVEQTHVTEYDTEAGYLVRYVMEPPSPGCTIPQIKKDGDTAAIERIAGLVEVAWKESAA